MNLGKFCGPVFMVWKCWKSACTKSLLHRDGHILHLLLIFIMPESQPFAQTFSANCSPPTSYENLWACLETMDTSGQSVCPRASAFELSILFYLPAWRAHTEHSLRACSYCIGPSRRTSHTNRSFNRIHGKTFCQALFHSNCSYGTELYTIIR